MKYSKSSPAPAGRESNTLVTVSEVAEQVGREILESRMEPGAWATALYECDGRRQDALALYTRLRVRQLTKKRRIRLSKIRSFESRRLTNCMGDQAMRESIAKTIQEMLGNAKTRGKPMNFAKPKLSIVWLMVLFFGTAGTVASLGRLLASRLPETFEHPLTLLALLAGVGAVWSALIIRRFLPKRWIMLGWNTGLVFTCNVLCLSSVLLGTKVIKQTMASGAEIFPSHKVSAPAQASAAKPPAKLVKPSAKAEPYLVSTATAKNSGGNRSSQ